MNDCRTPSNILERTNNLKNY